MGKKNRAVEQEEEVVVKKVAVKNPDKEIKALLNELANEKDSTTGKARAIRRRLRALGYKLSEHKVKAEVKKSKKVVDADDDEDEVVVKKSKKSRIVEDDDDDTDEDAE
jgi:hypothetical protein